jgi:sulfatase maturation enzyme AslB (radical SAM superfamily)
MRGKKYLSCIHLEQGLNIDKDFLTHCCVPHSNGKGNVKISDFQGDRLPMERILAARRELIALNQTEQDTPCKGCHLLVRKRWHGKQPLKYVNINDFYTCNLRCAYCFTQTESGVEHLKRQRKHDTLALFEDMVAQGYLAPDALVHWGGGEVAIYRHFEPVARLLANNGTTQFVNTNAVVFSKVIEQGLKQGNMVVQVSVDSGTRETFRLIKGRDAFDVVWRNLAQYTRAGDMQVKYIVMEDNNAPAEVDGFIEQCLASGVRDVLVAPESSESVRRVISQRTLRAAAGIILRALEQGMVVNYDAYEFGSFYAPQVRQHLDGLLAEHDKLNPRSALLVAKARRYTKRGLRYLKSRYIDRRRRP